jgi:hypothetical protein
MPVRFIWWSRYQNLTPLHLYLSQQVAKTILSISFGFIRWCTVSGRLWGRSSMWTSMWSRWCLALHCTAVIQASAIGDAQSC